MRKRRVRKEKERKRGKKKEKRRTEEPRRTVRDLLALRGDGYFSRPGGMRVASFRYLGMSK